MKYYFIKVKETFDLSEILFYLSEILFYQSEKKTFDPNEIVLDPNEILFHLEQRTQQRSLRSSSIIERTKHLKDTYERILY